MKIGVVWAGNPEQANDLRRSIELSVLAPLFAVPGTSFVSLQFGPHAADLKKLKRRTRSRSMICRRNSRTSPKRRRAISARSIW